MSDQRSRSYRYCRSTLLYSGALRRKRKKHFDFQSHSFGDFLLADDIGIIDHGALLEEESLAELEQKAVSISGLHSLILHRRQEFWNAISMKTISIQDDHNLRLHNLDLPVGKIVTAFVENGLEVSEAHTCEESLEDYFKRVTGGEGIA